MDLQAEEQQLCLSVRAPLPDAASGGCSRANQAKNIVSRKKKRSRSCLVNPPRPFVNPARSTSCGPTGGGAKRRRPEEEHKPERRCWAVDSSPSVLSISIGGHNPIRRSSDERCHAPRRCEETQAQELLGRPSREGRRWTASRRRAEKSAGVQRRWEAGGRPVRGDAL
nr:unnamed protein product [Digitaria exilis]